VRSIFGTVHSDRLRDALAGLKRRIVAGARVPTRNDGSIEADVSELLPEALSEYTNWQTARRQGRLIETEYSYHPKSRPLQMAGAGRHLADRLQAMQEAFRPVLRDLAGFAAELRTIPLDAIGQSAQPYWRNGWISPSDGVSLYGLVARYEPRRYVEIGSGNSTCFVRRAIRDFNLRTRIVSIDPEPREAIDAICDQVIRCSSEDVDQEFWESIGEDDMLFVDSSHRCFQNSDVSVFFTNILPVLRPATIYGLHDIFLPFDYPEEWCDRFYNEQYMLLSYLEGGSRGDEPLLPVAWICHQPHLREILNPIWKDTPALLEMASFGGAFWMRRARNQTPGQRSY
jgi:predicted O-methyltransferase YrrM